MHLQVAEKASLAERRANALAGGLKLAFLSSHLTCCSTGEMEEARALLDSAVPTASLAGKTVTGGRLNASGF